MEGRGREGETRGTRTETDALADAVSVSPGCELGAGESAAVVLCAADVVGTLLAEGVSADDAALLDPDPDDEAEEVAPELVDDNDDDDDDGEGSVEEEEELAVPMLDAVGRGTTLCDRASDHCTEARERRDGAHQITACREPNRALCTCGWVSVSVVQGKEGTYLPVGPLPRQTNRPK